MRLADVDPQTELGVYDPESGEYVSLGAGFTDSDHARRVAENEGFDEYLIVAELGHVGPLDDEGQ